MRPRRKAAGAEIEAVDESSPLYGKLIPGDRIISINGEKPLDIIDYLFLLGEEEVRLRVQSQGNERNLRLRRGAGESMGLTFTTPVFDGVRTCSNRCVFCFVDLMPPGLRHSLYIKDDDYRLSVLQGNFVTLNNLATRDLERILTMHLSPLYVSLHASDPRLRDRMMGGRGSERALRALCRLIEAGIEVHLQIVLCPGLNDAGQLDQTMNDILSAFPAESAGIVPVGLSGNEKPGGSLRPARKQDAERVIEMVGRFQAEAMSAHGRRLFYAADEFYILADTPFPPTEEYEDFPQLENGIGMARDLIDSAGGALRGRKGRRLAEETVVLTGRLGKVVLDQALRMPDGATIPGLEIRAVENRLFGPGVTVTGLLAGEDVLREVSCFPVNFRVLIPEVMLRGDEFLDSVNIDRVREASRAEVRLVETDGAALVEALGLEEERD